MREGQTPDVLGEEGALFHNDAFWIKRWTYEHGQNLEINDRHQEASTIGPHYAKFQYYQNKLIHTLFSENTIDIVAGYDPRITKDEDGGHSFSLEGGKPTTVSKHVEVEGQIAEDYQDTVHSMYAETAGDYEAIKRSQGGVDPELRERYDSTFDDVDDKLREMINAEEFKLYQGDFGDLTDPKVMEGFLRRLSTETRKINPKSPILEMLKAGVVPVHPSINFIPRESRDQSKKPDGTFLELKLFGFDRMEQYIRRLRRHDPEKHAKAQRMFEKFKIFNDINGMYDRLLGEFLNHDKLEYLDDEVINLLYQLTEKVLRASDEGDLINYNRVMNTEITSCIRLISSAQSLEQFTAGLRRQVEA